MSQSAKLRIAITDKNPHVREFLCRELNDLGHEASALGGVIELLQSLAGQTPPQVLVLDPEAAGTRLDEVSQRVRLLTDKTRVVLHIFSNSEPLGGFDGALVVEKEPHMGALKAAVAALSAATAAR